MSSVRLQAQPPPAPLPHSLSEQNRVFFTNLRLLGFEPEYVSAKERMAVQLNKDMFVMPNKKAFEIVFHFLFGRLDPKRCQEEFRFCYPVDDKKKDQAFRAVCNAWLGQLVKSETNISLGRVMPSLFMSPGGERFNLLAFNFSSLVLLHVTLHENGVSMKSALYRPVIGPKNLDMTQVMLETVQCGVISHRKAFLSSVQSNQLIQKEWSTAASKLSREYRSVSKICREKEAALDALRALQDNPDGNATNSPSRYAFKGNRGPSLQAYNLDINSKKRRDRVNKVRSLWKQVEDSLTDLAPQREIVEGVITGFSADGSLDVTPLDLRIPESLMRRRAEELARKGVGNLYMEGKVDLVALIKIWNVCLHLYIEQLRESGVPPFHEHQVHLEKVIHGHHRHLTAAQDLRNHLERQLIPEMKERVRELTEEPSGTTTSAASTQTPPPPTRSSAKKYQLQPATPPWNLNMSQNASANEERPVFVRPFTLDGKGGYTGQQNALFDTHNGAKPGMSPGVTRHLKSQHSDSRIPPAYSSVPGHVEIIDVGCEQSEPSLGTRKGRGETLGELWDEEDHSKNADDEDDCHDDDMGGGIFSPHSPVVVKREVPRPPQSSALSPAADLMRRQAITRSYQEKRYYSASSPGHFQSHRLESVVRESDGGQQVIGGMSQEAANEQEAESVVRDILTFSDDEDELKHPYSSQRGLWEDSGDDDDDDRNSDDKEAVLSPGQSPHRRTKLSPRSPGAAQMAALSADGGRDLFTHTRLHADEEEIFSTADEAEIVTVQGLTRLSPPGYSGDRASQHTEPEGRRSSSSSDEITFKLPTADSNVKSDGRFHPRLVSHQTPVIKSPLERKRGSFKKVSLYQSAIALERERMAEDSNEGEEVRTQSGRENGSGRGEGLELYRDQHGKVTSGNRCEFGGVSEGGEDQCSKDTFLERARVLDQLQRSVEAIQLSPHHVSPTHAKGSDTATSDGANGESNSNVRRTLTMGAASVVGGHVARGGSSRQREDSVSSKKASSGGAGHHEVVGGHRKGAGGHHKEVGGDSFSRTTYKDAAEDNQSPIGSAAEGQRPTSKSSSLDSDLLQRYQALKAKATQLNESLSKSIEQSPLLSETRVWDNSQLQVRGLASPPSVSAAGLIQRREQSSRVLDKSGNRSGNRSGTLSSTAATGDLIGRLRSGTAMSGSADPFRSGGGLTDDDRLSTVEEVDVGNSAASGQEEPDWMKDLYRGQMTEDWPFEDDGSGFGEGLALNDSVLLQSPGGLPSTD